MPPFFDSPCIIPDTVPRIPLSLELSDTDVCAFQSAGELIRSFPLSHHRSLGYRGRRCGFGTQHQSTKVKCPFLEREIERSGRRGRAQTILERSGRRGRAQTIAVPSSSFSPRLVMVAGLVGIDQGLSLERHPRSFDGQKERRGGGGQRDSE